MTHIFIVNEQTFDIHLKYLFAGTGNTNITIDLDSTAIEVSREERTLIGMIADISRVRIGDFVLFHVMGCKKLYGVFQVSSSPFFNDINDDYLFDELDKYLSFRIKIKPYKVFPAGIAERIVLDDISEIEHPYEMCWSLIYRKLTGLRGCSYITDFEFNRIFNMLESENNGCYLDGSNFSFNKDSSLIELDSVSYNYNGITTKSLDVSNRLYTIKKGAYEGHIQAFIMQNFDKMPLSNLLLPSSYSNLWIGNEVYCSVGEQRIDILIINEVPDAIIIRVIELKDETPSTEIVDNQIPWYITWVDEYLAPLYKSKKVYIIPTILAKAFSRTTDKKIRFYNKVKMYNKSNVIHLNNSYRKQLETIFYQKNNNSILFNKEIIF